MAGEETDLINSREFYIKNTDAAEFSGNMLLGTKFWFLTQVLLVWDETAVGFSKMKTKPTPLSMLTDFIRNINVHIDLVLLFSCT